MVDGDAMGDRNKIKRGNTILVGLRYDRRPHHGGRLQNGSKVEKDSSKPGINRDKEPDQGLAQAIGTLD